MSGMALLRADLYASMLEADARGDHAEAGRIAQAFALADERLNGARLRNQAQLGADSPSDRNCSLVGRPRGPLGEASFEAHHDNHGRVNFTAGYEIPRSVRERIEAFYAAAREALPKFS